MYYVNTASDLLSLTLPAKYIIHFFALRQQIFILTLKNTEC